MPKKPLPFSAGELASIVEKYPTPFHIYDEAAILANAERLKSAFAWNKGFKEYFAVKATPNPVLMKLLHRAGLGMDCSSKAELELSRRCGIIGEEIMFTSNDTPADEFQQAVELGAVVNLDDISHIAYLEQNAGLPSLVCCRYNPGSARAGNVIIGHPEDAKYGFTREQLFDGYRLLRDKGVKRFGLHTMVASNELNPTYFVETVQMLADLVVALSKELSITFEFINMGGGIGIPYKPDDSPVDLNQVSTGAKRVFEQTIRAASLPDPRLYMECGRMITGPYGFLVSRVLHRKETYKTYIGLDATMANLMRPGMYGAYHHISVVGKEDGAGQTELADVTGSLCENNDKFAVNRPMPRCEPGDLVVIHDTGAHGHAMGFNYNGKLRSAELLLRADRSVVEIRRPETIEDLFTTLNFDLLKQV
jgi:diaminopimelate decarboxylase